MTTQTKTNAKPAYRLCYAARGGVDANGQAQLRYPVEIGAVFNRKDPTKGLVAKFHFTPADMRDGVLLLMPVIQSDQAQEAGQ